MFYTPSNGKRHAFSGASRRMRNHARKETVQYETTGNAHVLRCGLARWTCWRPPSPLLVTNSCRTRVRACVRVCPPRRVQQSATSRRAKGVQGALPLFSRLEVSPLCSWPRRQDLERPRMTDCRRRGLHMTQMHQRPPVRSAATDTAVQGRHRGNYACKQFRQSVRQDVRG